MVPRVLRPADPEFYSDVPEPIGGWRPRLPTPEVLQRSLDKAHDNIRKLVTQNDEQRSLILRLEDHIASYKLWLKFAWLAIGGLVGTIGWIIKFLLPYAIRGMAQ